MKYLKNSLVKWLLPLLVEEIDVRIKSELEGIVKENRKLKTSLQNAENDILYMNDLANGIEDVSDSLVKKLLKIDLTADENMLLKRMIEDFLP